jgi:hypothetical protein
MDVPKFTLMHMVGSRWRKCRTVDSQIHYVKMPYLVLDAKVALIGGPTKYYAMKNGTCLNNLWLKENVICNMLISDF